MTVETKTKELSRAEWWTYHGCGRQTIYIWLNDRFVDLNEKKLMRLSKGIKFSMAEQDFQTTESGVIAL